MIAVNPAQIGPVRLVPPMPLLVAPSRTINGKSAPPAEIVDEGAAASGTQRIEPAGTPGPVCQAGRAKTVLGPPPVFAQTASPVGFQLESKVMAVPLSAVT